MLLQVPSSSPMVGQERNRSGGVLLDALVAQQHKALSRMEAHTLLHAYGIPVRQSLIAHNTTEAMFLAEQLGLPVDIQLETEQGQEKSTRVKLATIESVRSAVIDLIGASRSESTLKARQAVSVAQYKDRSESPQLLIRVFRDAVFGSVILLGAGGLHVEAHPDYAVALPPLNRFLARDLIQATRIGRSLEQSRSCSTDELAALEDIFMRVSEMICELPPLGSIEINPLVVGQGGGLGY